MNDTKVKKTYKPSDKIRVKKSLNKTQVEQIFKVKSNVLMSENQFKIGDMVKIKLKIRTSCNNEIFTGEWANAKVIGLDGDYVLIKFNQILNGCLNDVWNAYILKCHLVQYQSEYNSLEVN